MAYWRGSYRNRDRDMKTKTMKLPTRMIHQSFRYCLGRQSYAVADWCDWFKANYKEIPENELAIIRRELWEAVRHDDEYREYKTELRALGQDCDRAQWLKVLLLIDKE